MRRSIHSFLTKKTILIAGSIILIGIGLIVTLAVINTAKSPQENQTATKESPNFQTVLPSNTSIETLGGWTRISPPENDPVFAYTDTINDVSITVSQQPAPSSFKNNLDTEVAEVAKKFNATSQLDAGSVKAYIGTSAKGPQSVIFVKNNLLILMKSVQKIDDSKWISYIKSLS